MPLAGSDYGTSYTSTKPVPLLPFTPVTTTVYAPGASVVTSTASRLVASEKPKAPTSVNVLLNTALPPQLSLWSTRVLPRNSSSCGSEIESETPKAPKVGPTARIITLRVVFPATTKPTFGASEPAPT